MNDKILTISVACYNASQYIDKCIECFLNINNEKILDKIDIILIDDGSKDDTYKKALDYQNQYSNFIRVIKKENGGWGSTINEAINYANGKYFKILDVDDWYDTKNIVDFVLFLEHNEKDLIISSYYEHNIKKDVYNFKTFCFNQMHALCFKTSILKNNNIKLTEHCFYTDLEFILYNIKNCKTYDVFDNTVYVYNIGFSNQSISWDGFKKNIQHHFTVINNLIEDYKNVDENLFLENNNISIFKIYEDVLMEAICKHFCILYKFDFGNETLNKILEFDNWLKEKNFVLYSKIKLKRVLLLRKNVRLFPVLWLLVDVRSKIYNLIKFS